MPARTNHPQAMRRPSAVAKTSGIPKRMRGAPHNGLACAICLIKALTCELTGGRPAPFRRESLVQKSLNPSRCQRRTVSGLTIKKAERH